MSVPPLSPASVARRSARDPLTRYAIFICLLLVSWVVMTMSHEAGHLVGGWLSGAVLQNAEMRPWRLPYSVHVPDPHPLVTLWAGPIVGSVGPLLLATIIRHRWVWFVGYFCLLANGVYLASGWYAGDQLLDTNRLFGNGASRTSVATFIAISIGIGYPQFRRACQTELSYERMKDEP